MNTLISMGQKIQHKACGKGSVEAINGQMQSECHDKNRQQGQNHSQNNPTYRLGRSWQLWVPHGQTIGQPLLVSPDLCNNKKQNKTPRSLGFVNWGLTWITLRFTSDQTLWAGNGWWPRCLSKTLTSQRGGLVSQAVQLLSCVQLFATPWITAHQASLSIINSQSPPKPMSIELVMPSNHLILCCPLLLLPSIFPSIRVFSNESAHRMRWPKYWSFSFNISPSNKHPGLISFRMDWLDLLAVDTSHKNTGAWHHMMFLRV